MLLVEVSHNNKDFSNDMPFERPVMKPIALSDKHISHAGLLEPRNLAFARRIVVGPIHPKDPQPQNANTMGPSDDRVQISANQHMF